MTLGRIDSSERYKGFDEILDVLPQLLEGGDGLVYLIVGHGDDVERLKKKANALGISGNVVFTGFVTEDQKADHFRMADVYVMPSYGEGFGFVFLEAMACGTPVIGSSIDGGREALCNGNLGILVNPHDREEIIEAINKAMNVASNIPKGLEIFSFDNFQNKIHLFINELLCLNTK